jgi:4-alpha-glucanotransferase
MVCYIGTHDNDPLKGYLEKMDAEEKEKWALALEKMKAKVENIEEQLLYYAFSRKCAYTIVSLQDLLLLDSSSRINEPGLVNEINWTWRLKDFEGVEGALLAFRHLIEETGRI